MPPEPWRWTCQNSRYQKCDMQQVPRWVSTTIRRQRSEFSPPGDLKHGIGAPQVFPCFFLSCKPNARVKTAKRGHGPHSSKFLCCSHVFFVLFYVFFVLFSCIFCVVLCIFCVVLMYFLCCSMYFLCCSMYCLFCAVLCIVCVCICVLYYCHRVATQMQLTL